MLFTTWNKERECQSPVVVQSLIALPVSDPSVKWVRLGWRAERSAVCLCGNQTSTESVFCCRAAHRMEISTDVFVLSFLVFSYVRLAGIMLPLICSVLRRRGKDTVRHLQHHLWADKDNLSLTFSETKRVVIPALWLKQRLSSSLCLFLCYHEQIQSHRVSWVHETDLLQSLTKIHPKPGSLWGLNTLTWIMKVESNSPGSEEKEKQPVLSQTLSLNARNKARKLTGALPQRSIRTEEREESHVARNKREAMVPNHKTNNAARFLSPQIPHGLTAAE